MNLIVRPVCGKEKIILKPLINNNPHNPYHALRSYCEPEGLNAYYYELFVGGNGVKVLAAFSQRKIAGFTAFAISDWDSKVFGIKMAAIKYITAIGSYANALAIKRKLLKSVICELQKWGVKHLSARVECNDFSSVHAFESCGFRIMDNLLTYLFRKDEIISPDAGRWFKVRKMRKDHLDEAGAICEKYCTLGHYSADPSIPTYKTANMYRKWLESMLINRKDVDIFVATRGRKIEGCSFMVFNALLNKYTGLKTISRGLVAVSPLARGCSIALINAQIKERKDLDFAEFETQTYNRPMMSVIQRLNMNLIRSRYTLHRILL